MQMWLLYCGNRGMGANVAFVSCWCCGVGAAVAFSLLWHLCCEIGAVVGFGAAVSFDVSMIFKLGNMHSCVCALAFSVQS